MSSSPIGCVLAFGIGCPWWWILQTFSLNSLTFWWQSKSESLFFAFKESSFSWKISSMFGMSSLENNNNIYTGKILRELFTVLLKGSLFFCASQALWLQKFLIVICRIFDFGIIFLSKFWKDGVPLLQSIDIHATVFRWGIQRIRDIMGFSWRALKSALHILILHSPVSHQVIIL